MKNVIITGSSSGFGMLTAIQLAKENFHVYATMRNVHKKNELLRLAEKHHVTENITVWPLDVTSNQSINHFKERLLQLNHIDILINNAGYAVGGFCEDLSIEKYREQFETNVFGLIGVTQAVLPLMRKKKNGKIINISSISGQMGFPGLSPYVSSKHAIEGFSESLRLELKPYGIDVVLVEPGSYQTNIWSNVDSILDYVNEIKSPYETYIKKIENEIQKEQKAFGDPLEVALLITALCKKNQIPKLRYPIGKGVRANLFIKKLLSWKQWERLVFKKLGIERNNNIVK